MTNKSIADSIRDQIKSKHVTMRPKAYFTAGAALLGVGLAASVLVAVFFIGVIVFRLRVNAPFDYLRETKGIVPLLENIPWIPVLIAIAGILGGIFIMRKFDFSYKHAFAGIAGGFLIAIGVFGIIVDATGLPEQAEQFESLQPFLHTKYSNDSWVAGTVILIQNDNLEIETPNAITYTILIEPETVFIPNTPIGVGEWVRILGDRNNDTFAADEIMHRESPRRNPHILGIPPGSPMPRPAF